MGHEKAFSRGPNVTRESWPFSSFSNGKEGIEDRVIAFGLGMKTQWNDH
jgi:hypothetical protein